MSGLVAVHGGGGGGDGSPVAGSGSSRASPSGDGGGGAGDASATAPPSRYEAQKRRDWNTFGQYLRNHRPPLTLQRCIGANVLEFLRYLDQFGKTKIHAPACPFFGIAHPPAPCACPLRQAWGSLDALIGRLRAAFEEHGGKPESNPFGARAVRLYLREVREMQAKARGIAYEKKKRKRPSNNAAGGGGGGAGASGSSNTNSTSNTSCSSITNNSGGSTPTSASANAHAHAQQTHVHVPTQQQVVHNLHQQHHHHVLQQSLPLIQHQQLQQHHHPQQQFLTQALQPGANCLQILN